jgi:protein gp37
MNKTSIPWCDYTWNVTTGCTPVSSGCARCYAKRIYERFHPKESFSDVRCHPERLDQPLNVRKPQRIFIDSMSDLFHKDVPIQFIAAVWARMIATPQHTYVILTKRPRAMLDIVPHLFFNYIEDRLTILPNVWLGVSVEDQATADERIPLLLQTPAAVRFVSVEPMLGAIDLAKGTGCLGSWLIDSSGNRVKDPEGGIDWLVCGAESGPHARPMSGLWVRSLKDQCVAAGIPFFYKQGPDYNGKIIKMPELDGRVWNQMPEVKP